MKRISAIALCALLLSSCAVSRSLRPAPSLGEPDLGAAVFDSIEAPWRPMAKALAESGKMIPSGGNSVEIFTDGHGKFSALEEDIKGASESIDMEYYRFATDNISRKVRDLLVEKAEEEVPVRLILENRTNAIKPSFYRPLRNTPGLRTLSVQPLRDVVGSLVNMDFRDHRKIVLIDGNICYTGGMNVAEEYHSIWRDTHLRLRGPVVNDYGRLFDNFWEHFRGDTLEGHVFNAGRQEEGVIIQVAGDGPHTKEKPVRQGFELGLDSAKDYIYIQTPYLCPPVRILRAMGRAAKRGVDVRLMLPEKQDVPVMLWVNRFFYGRILRSGVRIFERGDPYIHSKSYVSDDYLSCYGTANIDNRSCNLNYESNLFVYDREVALRSKEIFLSDLAESREILPKDTRWKLTDRLMQYLTILLGYYQW